MKIKSILALFILFTTFSFAQVYRNADIFNPNGGLAIKVNNNKSNGIEGSKHLFATWDGNYIVQSIKGTRYNLNNLNYNLQSKKLESLLTKDSIFELKSNQVDYILTNNKRYKVINEELFQELNNGKFKIYKQFTVKVQDAFINPMTKTESGAPQYVQVPKYFYYRNDILTPFKLKKKDVLGLLSDKESEIKKYADDKDFSFSEEHDVIKIINYYNTL